MTPLRENPTPATAPISKPFQAYEATAWGLGKKAGGALGSRMPCLSGLGD